MRTSTIIALAFLAIGGLTFGILSLQEETPIAFVAAVQSNPEAHQEGTFLLMGIPHTDLQPGALYQNTTTRTEDWSDGNTAYRSTITTTVTFHEDRSTSWHVQNVTRDLLEGVVTQTQDAQFEMGANVHVFQVRAFEDTENTDPIWIVYDGPLKDPLQAAPVQVKGQVATNHGVPIWEANHITIGCSSKFIPDDQLEIHDKDGDGFADDAYTS